VAGGEGVRGQKEGAIDLGRHHFGPALCSEDGIGDLSLERLKSNRRVNPDGRGNVPIREVEIPAEGRVVHLRGFGFVKVFRMVSTDGDAESWATNDLGMTEGKRAELERQGWGIEVYHRGLKRCYGVEKAQVRKAVAILRHLLLALRAFLRLEVYRLRTGVSCMRQSWLSFGRRSEPIWLIPSMSSTQLRKSYCVKAFGLRLCHHAHPLFPDTKLGKNFPKQLIASHFAGDFP
jgi:hypothetical protein